ncbi:hypothetical protein [Halobacterium noricense]|uniref:hypothetical protein n=1 Tax=Halobacterium noricense TaxID=223182 RepID=UPI001E3DF694|nr:hypothetical protein [Halobacterium noricense]UHH24612.1 hypothetical protein LT974_11530 [Halobacterium noricense]
MAKANGTVEGGDSDDTFRRATEAVKRRAGDALRIVFRYEPDSVDVRYVDDCRLDEDLLPRLQRLQERALELGDATASTEIDAHGEVETVLAVHEDAVVLYLLVAPDEGLVAVHGRTGEPLGGDLL